MTRARQMRNAELFWRDLVGSRGLAAEDIGEALNRDSFRCPASSSVVVASSVVDGMLATETRSGESLSVDGLCAGAAPAICPNPHQLVHGRPGATASDAAHFTGLSADTIRTAEIAGLWGVDLRSVASRDRPSTPVKTRPTAAPLQSLSFVAIRKNERRAIHIGRETPRRVEAWVDDQPWLSLASTAGLPYRLFKRRFWEASFHRQWGTLFTVSWIAGLMTFYRDNTGLMMGVGDVSHVVGEVMTDHGSHRVGKDVDCYVLDDPPAGSTFPGAFWTSGTRDSLEIRELSAPSSTAPQPEYTLSSRAAPITDPRRATLLDRYATILAYCVATQAGVNAAVWHGAPALEARALAIAQAAWDRTAAAGAGTRERPGWRATWGYGPATRAAITAPRANLFIGAGSSSYEQTGGWPNHPDHIHVRLL
jgi:hypothetical protein